MIDQGIVELVNADSVVGPLLSPLGGGFFAQLPKDDALPSWTYRYFGGVPISGLATVGGLVMRRLQIDVYGAAAADAITLASAIDHVLHGYHGTLSDPDHTVVDSISLIEEPMDFFDDARRSYRRLLEYEVWFVH